jgi:hypothetical protein
MRRRKRSNAARRPKVAPGPDVHIKVAHASNDFHAATNLVKAAVLYGDRVTLYSPTAEIIRAFDAFDQTKSPREKVELFRAITFGVPSFRAGMSVSDESLEQMFSVMSLNRSEQRKLPGLAELRQGFESLWEDLPAKMRDIAVDLGADGLMAAVAAGKVTLEPLAVNRASSVIVDSLRLATGDTALETSDDAVQLFATKVFELTNEPRTFGLFDAQSAGLLRSLETILDRAGSHSMERSAEVTAAAAFMGYMPTFPLMSMDEVIDLRNSVGSPLLRFRAAIARMSSTFSRGPLDADFELEVEDAWRKEVAEAMADIREAFGEHRLLKEFASISSGDLSSLLVEAGGALTLTKMVVNPTSASLYAAAGVAMPTIGRVARAATQRSKIRATAKSSDYFFLHHFQ